MWSLKHRPNSAGIIECFKCLYVADVNGGNLAVLYCFVLLPCVRRPGANQAVTRCCRKRGKLGITLATRSSSGRPLGLRISRLAEEMSPLAIRLRSKLPYQLT